MEKARARMCVRSPAFDDAPDPLLTAVKMRLAASDLVRGAVSSNGDLIGPIQSQNWQPEARLQLDSQRRLTQVCCRRRRLLNALALTGEADLIRQIQVVRWQGWLLARVLD